MFPQLYPHRTSIIEIGTKLALLSIMHELLRSDAGVAVPNCLYSPNLHQRLPLQSQPITSKQGRLPLTSISDLLNTLLVHTMMCLHDKGLVVRRTTLARCSRTGEGQAASDTRVLAPNQES